LKLPQIRKNKENKSSMAFNEQALKRVGIQIISTERVNQRLDALKEFNKTLDLKPPSDLTADKLFEWHVGNWNKLWNMYTESQVAWFRAGSKGIFAEIVFLVEDIKESVEVAIEANRANLIFYSKLIEEAQKRKDNQAEIRINNKKLQLVRDFHITWLIKLGYKAVGKVGRLCWFLEDVNTPESFPIMSNQPIQLDRVNLGGSDIINETQTSGKRRERV